MSARKGRAFLDDWTGSMWVLIFAKYPQPGMVKTRLCPPLSLEEAAQVHAACVRHVYANVAARAGAQPILVAAPDDAVDGFRELVGAAAEIWPQGEGNLGARLSRASARAFEAGANMVVLVGTDSPTMRWSLIEELPLRLCHAGAAIGPCADGGYYLLALRSHQPELFENIDWGGERVAAQTRARARAANVVLYEAEEGYDIDRVDDLRRALADLEASAAEGMLVDTLRKVLADRKGAG